MIRTKIFFITDKKLTIILLGIETIRKMMRVSAKLKVPNLKSFSNYTQQVVRYNHKTITKLRFINFIRYVLHSVKFLNFS